MKPRLSFLLAVACASLNDRLQGRALAINDDAVFAPNEAAHGTESLDADATPRVVPQRRRDHRQRRPALHLACRRDRHPARDPPQRPGGHRRAGRGPQGRWPSSACTPDTLPGVAAGAVAANAELVADLTTPRLRQGAARRVGHLRRVRPLAFRGGRRRAIPCRSSTACRASWSCPNIELTSSLTLYSHDCHSYLFENPCQPIRASRPTSSPRWACRRANPSRSTTPTTTSRTAACWRSTPRSSPATRRSSSCRTTPCATRTANAQGVDAVPQLHRAGRARHHKPVRRVRAV